SAGRHADDDVRGPDVLGGHGGGAGRRVVLGALDGPALGGLAAGDDGRDQVGRRGERRRALGGVHDGDPAGSAGADVAQTAAAGEARGDGVYGLGQFGEDGGDRLGHGRV